MCPLLLQDIASGKGGPQNSIGCKAGPGGRVTAGHDEHVALHKPRTAAGNGCVEVMRAEGWLIDCEKGRGNGAARIPPSEDCEIRFLLPGVAERKGGGILPAHPSMLQPSRYSFFMNWLASGVSGLVPVLGSY